MVENLSKELQKHIFIYCYSKCGYSFLYNNVINLPHINYTKVEGNM